MRYSTYCLLVLSVFVAILSAGCPPAKPAAIRSFVINDGDASTGERAVTLNNVCTANPTHFMASESALFDGASWQAYESAPSFTLSPGNGTKTVYFKVKNAVGESSAMNDTITLDAIAAAFTAATRIGAAPLSVQFTDQSSVKGSPIDTWFWDFGDGETSTNSSPLHEYADAGPYSVSLTVTSSDGTDTESKFRYIQADGPSEHSFMLPGDVPLTMVWISSGSFAMGSPNGEAGGSDTERPVHTVELTHGYWMSKYPVTKAQWTAVMSTTPWAGAGNVILDPDSPAVCITWANTQSFMTAINTLTSKVFRLPSEAEWEYACRAGTDTRFYWGDDPALSEIGDYAWWSGNAADVADQAFAHIVGLKLPNAWGLYDMNGNVWVWINDYWVAGYTAGPVTNPTGPATGTDRVVRGGGWYNPAYQTHRSAFRANQDPTGVYTDYGFRVCTSSDL